MTENAVPHSHKLARNNKGLADLDPYQECPLPEDYNIVELLGDVIQVVYADVAQDGKSVVRNGIILPDGVIDSKAWRVGRVVLTGPDTKQVKSGHYVIFPGDKGIKGIQKNGVLNIFLNEERIFGIVEPKQ
jgi:hypothetical protein